MKKFFCVLLCIAVVVGYMPAVGMNVAYADEGGGVVVSSTSVEVESADDFWNAVENPSVEEIIITGDITLDRGFDVTRDLTITEKGDNPTLTFDVNDSNSKLVVTEGKKLTITSENTLLTVVYKGLDSCESSAIIVKKNANVTLNHVEFYTAGSVILAEGENSKVVVENSSKIYGGAYCISTNHTTSKNVDIKLTDSDFFTFNADAFDKYGLPDIENYDGSNLADIGILINVAGKVTMKNGSVTSHKICLMDRGGTVEAEGVRFRELGDSTDYPHQDIPWDTGRGVATAAVLVGNRTFPEYDADAIVILTSCDIITGGNEAVFLTKYEGENSPKSSLTIKGDSKDLNYGIIGSLRTDYGAELIIMGGHFVIRVSTFLAANHIQLSDGTVHPKFAAGEKAYGSLQEAINGATDGDVVKIYSEAEVKDNIVIPAEKNIILDLNGHVINGKNVDEKAALTNNGTLTVKGKGTIKREDNGTLGYYTILNKGNLTLTDVDVINHSGEAVNCNGSSLVYNVGTAKAPAILTIDSGTYEQPDFSLIKNYDYGKLIINGGTFKTDDHEGNITQAVQNWNVAEINGGTFEGAVESWDYTGSHAELSTITIHGGDFKKAIAERLYTETAPAPKIVIDGGKFATDVTAFLAEGYIQNDEGMVVEKPATEVIPSDGGSGRRTRIHAPAEIEIHDEIVPLATLPDLIVTLTNLAGKWYEAAAKWAASKGLMIGITATDFGGELVLNKAQVVSILARLNGVDKETSWNEAFAKYANEEINRETTAALLYAFAKEHKMVAKDFVETGILSEAVAAYTDVSTIDASNIDAVNWGVSVGLFRGVTDNNLDIKGQLTRAQFATLLQRFVALSEAANL